MRFSESGNLVAPATPTDTVGEHGEQGQHHTEQSAGSEPSDDAAGDDTRREKVTREQLHFSIEV
ncbi:enhancer of polycomb [Culex quinquefasciatus]|uniref:Enhancer of polycomb n=1 Tax=Culex quinquefasciatus TaxID=7176 RepID=B0X3F1_CULQU|nr:enhancer of polycomb [Culex quinquefasciatus]|eukprot:XP_001864173.1 enhancer of polycomb [Culex quinquefasciatus]